MALESIIEHITGEANAQKENLIRDANLQAEVIIKDAQTEAAQIYKDTFEKGRASLEAEQQKLIVNARLEARKKLLFAKQGLIDKVFEGLKNEIDKEKLKKKQILHDKVKEVSEDFDFYLNQLRRACETELARILFDNRQD